MWRILLSTPSLLLLPFISLVRFKGNMNESHLTNKESNSDDSLLYNITQPAYSNFEVVNDNCTYDMTLFICYLYYENAKKSC